MRNNEAELAEQYNQTHDVSGFESEAEPIEVRRNVTISVRFSAEEIDTLRQRADEAGVKVTAYIRSAALEAGRPLDRSALSRRVAVLVEQAHELRDVVGWPAGGERPGQDTGLTP